MELLLISLLRATARGYQTLGCAATEAQVRWAINTGLGPLLRQLIASTPEVIPPECAVPLLMSELSAKTMSRRHLAAMAEILDACQGSVESVTLLKGISICEQYYPMPYLRPMGDIDFLVPSPAVSTVESVLFDLGYEQRSSYPLSFYQQHHHSMPFHHPHTQVRVEVHTELFSPRSGLAQNRVFALPNVRTQLCCSEFQGRRVYRLSNELQLLYISAHAIYELRIFRSLIPFLDIVLLLQRAGPAMDWDLVVDWLDEPRISSYLGIILSYLESHKLIELAPALCGAIARAKKRIGRLALGLMHRDIDRYAARGLPIGGFIGPELHSILWRTLLSPRPPLINLLTVPWNLAFPPGHPDRFKPSFQLERLRSAFGSLKAPPDSGSR